MKPNRHKWLGLALAVALAVPACGGDKTGGEQDVPRIEIPTGAKADDLNEPIDTMTCPEPDRLFRAPSAWTVMHFAAADNNLEDVIVEDINEMEMGHRGSNNVNIIVQLDKYYEDGIWRYRVEPDSDMNKVNSRLIGYSEEEYDSGDWRTLAWFGKWAVTCYPADNYVLIIGGHGGGWSRSPDGRAGERPSLRERARHKRATRQGETLRMIAPDDTNGSEIYINQLAQAMKVIQAATVRPDDPAYINRLVAYGSDACLMETVEVAYELRNSVTYLLGSEETEPGEGWPYSTIVRGLTERPFYYATRHHELVSLVVEKYGTSYGPGGVVGQTGWITFAGIDTSALVKARNRIDSVASLLTELLDEDDNLSGLVFSARWDSYEFGDGYVDLGQFMAKLKSTLIEAGKMPASGQHWDGDERWRDLRKAIDGLLNDVWPDLVVANLVTDTYPEASGVSIFFPSDDCGWGLDLDDYAQAPFSKDSAWDELLSKLVADGGGSFEEGYGYGETDLTLDDYDFSLYADCEVYDNWLYVYAWDDDEYYVDMSLDLEINGSSLVAYGGYLYAELEDQEWDAEGYDMEVEVSNAQVDHGDYYSGTVTLELQDYYTDENVEVTVSFVCEDFETYSCYDDDWW